MNPAARVSEESFLSNEVSPSPVDPDFTAELGGARRLAGLPASIVLTVGVPTEQTDELKGALPECRFVVKALDAITPEVCGSLIPTLIMVDATAPIGREFIMELRTAACGRFVPVVALTSDGGPPPGADAAVHLDGPVQAWAEPIRQLLP